MKCPHCLTDFHDEPTETILHRGQGQLTERDETSWVARSRLCPACGRAIIVLIATRWVSGPSGSSIARTREIQVWPKGIARAPLPQEVTKDFASDYRESCNVLAESPKASAALSRYCLQRLLREVAKVKPADLSKEIDEVLASKTLPSHLAGAIDAIRAVGNFAAHPLKSTNTGAIIEVEPGEAELLLDVLEGLFNFYFVQPAVMAKKLAEVNKKLTEAGKPPLKQ